jgi:hypothetical protein
LLYRPPPSKQNGLTTNQFFNEFSDLLDCTTTSSGKLLLCGDFNFHWDNQQHSDTMHMKDILESAGLQQLVSGPTHTSGHTIDWILTRESENLVSKTEISHLISDHHMIHCSLSLFKPPLPQIVQSYRCYKAINLDELQSEIEQSDLIKEPAETLDSKLDQYNDILTSIINKLAPQKTRRVTVRPVTPWYNEMIHAAKVERRKCEANWRRSGLTVHFEMYKTARNKVTALIGKAKTSYYSEKVQDCDTDQKALFRVVDEILGRNKKQALPPHTSIKEVRERFSDYFKTKIETIRSNLDSEVKDELPNVVYVLPLPDPAPAGHLTTLHPLTTEEVHKLITKAPTKSCTLDPLPTWLLKKVVTPLLQPITDIVNTSLEYNTFPSAMKKALVTPLLKKPTLDKSILKNYRPVSNLSFISKITERAVLTQLTDHMDKYDLHSPVQSAYRTNHSTETALLKIQNDILMGLDSGQGMILVLLDLSAAFDTIDHDILVSRLQSRIGIQDPAKQWFESYLQHRFQSIYLNGSSSDAIELLYGVPQGSVLGPSDFTCYTGPTYHIASHHGISIHKYADDTQLYLGFDFEKQETAIAQMECCVNDIRAWMRDNKLKLNDDKTELLIITTARQAHKVTIDHIKIGDCTVKAVPIAKNLGATFDNTMTLNNHVTALIKSCNFQLRSVGQARKFLTQKAADKIIHAFISSRLDCGNSLLYNLPEYQLQRVQRVQNTAARILTKTHKFDHISPVLDSLHWLPIQKRIEFKILILTFKCVHGPAPKYLAELIHPYLPTRTLRSSDQLLLQIPKTRLKSYGDRSFTKAAPTLWNSLPLHIRTLTSLDSFKSNLKTFLFERS